ncbi:MAG: endonuclease/exonuclease/phosphatase family protein [Verrucomicrobia bacterium]|nr:endonuclease/exonuclease/phosphatase family protein [Verrucomicrobiota bacterium]
MSITSSLATNVVTVMTFNLRYASAPDGDNTWENADQVPDRRQVALSVLQDYAPDIVGFQEGEDQQLDYLAANLPAYSFERQKPSGGSGNENAAIAYDTNKLELLDRGVISLGNSPGGGYWNNTPGVDFKPWDIFPENNFAFPRLALWGRFRWTATQQEFIFYSTHFDVFNGSNDGESQVKSARLVTDDALSRNDRMPASPLAIVVGDFNGSQNNRAWKLFTGAYTNNGISGDFTDSWQQVHGTWTDSGTFHGFAGGTLPGSSRIDWILHRGGLAATQAVIITDSAISTNQSGGGTHTLYPSDHYPVLARLRLPDLFADFDKDGLPDALELASPLSLPADPDTDGDRLLDGEENLNGDSAVDGGESDPQNGTDTQLPTDIRNYQMDGLADYQSSQLGANGLELYWRFDGRHLYLATQDAGEGSDHFIFVAPTPDNPVSAPWAKTGQVSAWDAYLADENDGGFTGWFDATGSQITNQFAARATTYFENGGWVEGVIDLAQIYGSGFTNSFYIAAGPYGTADGGALYPPAQVPGGNSDGDILGADEYIVVHPGDFDGDGINDYADPDRDGDHLPDKWETAHGLDPDDASGDNGTAGDPDGDHLDNLSELRACTSPSLAGSVLDIRAGLLGGNLRLTWPGVHSNRYVVEHLTEPLTVFKPWFGIYTNHSNPVFPVATNSLLHTLESAHGFYRIRVLQ